jgi:putative addiction module component (TIGR02574 family)
MKTISAVDTLALSIPERIQLVEDIWDTIAIQADAIELSAEEKRIVDERVDAFHKNPAAGSPWEEVFNRIRSR